MVVVARFPGEVVIAQVVDVLGAGLVGDALEHVAREDLGAEDGGHA